MRTILYNLLVNQIPGIQDRYLKKRKENNQKKWSAIVYLLWLNIQYYLFFQKKLYWPDGCKFYEDKLLFSEGSESSISKQPSPEQLVRELTKYDIISFDVFDTLLFRFLSDPTDLFYFISIDFNYPNLKQIRIQSEQRARKIKHKTCGTWEVSLEEIWGVMEQETGIPKEIGMQTEWNYEQKCCYPNPYMLQVVKALKRQNKPILATSDMYLGTSRLQTLLKQSGYGEFSHYFVSCDYQKSKHDGLLFQEIQNKLGKNRTYIHIGDHQFSDQKQPNKHQINSILYPNINLTGNRYRPNDMSAIVGSIYRGIVNAHIHNGSSIFSKEYEYGFIYGGLFVTGYCQFIHHYVKSHQIEKILFLSRDGAVLLQAYQKMFPEDRNKVEYVYWSRLAALKLTCQYYKKEYFQRFLLHKADQGYTVHQILTGMELADMTTSLCETLKINPKTKLTYKNIEKIKKYLMDSWEQVLEHYRKQQLAGKMYYMERLKGCQSVAAVDIGWAGSGAIMLDCAINKIWNLQCRVTGILAGTNGFFCAENDVAEPFLMSGKLVSYLYSQQINRDLWKFHDPAKKHNLYWELLLGAPVGSLKGFYLDENGDYKCKFKEFHSCPHRIRKIHKGILDFVDQFLRAEQKLKQPILICGRDAYAPMLLIQNKKNRKFMRDLEDLMDEVHIS